MQATLVVSLAKSDQFYSNSIYLNKNDFPNVSVNEDGLFYISINNKKFTAEFNDTVEKGSANMTRLVRQHLDVSKGDIITCCILNMEIKDLNVVKSININIVPLQKNFSLDVYTELKTQTLLSNIKDLLLKEPVVKDRSYPFSNLLELSSSKELKAVPVLFKVSDIDIYNNDTYGRVSEDTKIYFDISLFKKFKLDDISYYVQRNNNFMQKVRNNLSDVGGIKDQYIRILNEVLLPRALPPETLDKYNLKQTKGVIFYGPSGTGKTLTAREIGKMFTDEANIKVIKGPELLDKYVGGSEAKLREYFEPAKKDWDENGRDGSKLHIIIIDEIEALCSSRKLDNSSTQTNSKLTATLLNELDGIEEYDNFVIFGLTNLIDRLDEALLRSGRFGLHLEFGLPDFKGRLEILNIHTKKIKINNLIDENISLEKFAKITENWTGAELAELVSLASKNASSRNFTIEGDGKINIDRDKKLEIVTLSDFEDAYNNINPLYAGNVNSQTHDNVKFFKYSKELKEIYNQSLIEINSIKSGVSSIGIVGDLGCGKTTLALTLARESGSKCIELIDYKQMRRLNYTDRSKLIEDKFTRALKSSSGAVIIDNIEDILGASPEGYNYSNELRIDILDQINSDIGIDKKLLVIITSKNENLFKQCRFEDACYLNCTVNKINTISDILFILQSMNIKVKCLSNNILNNSVDPLSIKHLLHKIELYINNITNNKSDELILEKFLENQGIDIKRDLSDKNTDLDKNFSKIDQDYNMSSSSGINSFLYKKNNI